jgi:molybdopterin-containing oxidoreductase family membrane subunit
MIVLNVYLFLNIFVGWVVLTAEKKEVAPPKWIKPFIYISIPWAVSIHTVTAFLYAGLPGRHFWLTAILAPRFLASALPAALLSLSCCA